MTRASHRLVMVLSVVVSILIHALVLLPALVAAATAEAGYTELEHELANEMQERFPEDEPERLGLEESDQSTMTWIGYDTYKEHLAQLAEFDQAEFVDASSPANATTEGETPAPQPGRAAPTGASPRPAAEQQATPAGGGPIDGTGEQGGGLPSQGQGPLSPAEPGPAEDEGTTPDSGASPEPTPPDTPEKPGEAPASGGGAPPSNPSDEPTPPEPNASDRESDATSTIKVPRSNWMSGKPLASQGLELVPRKPIFTTLQTLSGAANMVVVIEFDGNGKPEKAAILSSSGSPSIDIAVLASLYRWRARGERLEGLDEDETVDVRLELIMTRKRR